MTEPLEFLKDQFNDTAAKLPNSATNAASVIGNFAAVSLN